jgi:hypothetical protein
VRRKEVLEVKKECGISKTMPHLIMITLWETKRIVKAQGKLSGEFMINCGLRQRNVQLTDSFNLISETIIRETEVKGRFLAEPCNTLHKQVM